MKIYLAARYTRRDELREYAKALRALGHEVTSRWLAERKDPGCTVDDVTEGEHLRIAERDLEDIAAADMFVAFTREPKGNKRGGHHVELGYALAREKEIILLEGRENSFHYLEGIDFFETFEEFLVALQEAEPTEAPIGARR